MKYKRDQLFSVAELKERGWTKKLIKKYLPEPDQLKTNPIFRKRPKMKLYLKWIVERTEKATVFVKALQKAKNHSQKMKAAAANSRQNLPVEGSQKQFTPEVINNEYCQDKPERLLSKDNL